ncbi:hypothetical protein BVRB_5g099130 [Beta vulgaris subsp. vulgaris]|uniref:uncharacterized protein LOC104892180 n=1 Tax=Beta vulgaris subsp. vulgaris TaxID=3555 RepID=UPI00053FA558|nr:uncharacterized protein LOC104892180 [Beta vulgaris subsp. vulgaris]XP_010676322.1 uncharacterized protein LOC104892180 [Beta vulgaris subsp. vulgaris]KMT11953.1 hypothetical protein BVRB_5g099130 [Beta vulgaris subsp. vulgaris]
MALNCIFYVHTTSIPTSLIPSIPSYSLQIPPSSFLKIKENSKFNSINNGSSFTITSRRRNRQVIVYGFLPVDPWAPNIDSQSIASQLFAFSLFPYLGFLYFITKSKTAPKLTLFGFYFLLAFVGATIPAGIYAKVHYGTSLSNVDWLHGGAESLLTLTNLFIVLGLRKALREPTNSEENQSAEVTGSKDENSSS